MSDIDYNQDPADFLSLANNSVPADPQGQPTVQEPGAETTPAMPSIEKEGEEKDPISTPELTDPQGQPAVMEETEKERLNASQKITELGQERAHLFNTYIDLMDDNPDLIKDIYGRDPKLADQIIQKHWGYTSFDELMAHARVSELEATDPDQADIERRLLEVESSNKTLRSKLQKTAEESFYLNKGISQNPFDPNYQAVQNALDKVSPILIQENFSEALEIAHSIAFPGKTSAEIEADKKRISLAMGTSTPVAGGISPSPTPKTNLTPEQSGFMSLVRG